MVSPDVACPLSDALLAVTFASFPRFRFAPRQADSHDLELQNHFWEMEGVGLMAPENVAASMEQAGAVKRLSTEQLRFYLEHPDERVPLALLANPYRPWGRRHRVVSTRLWLRGMRSARNERVLWTPLLDALQEGGFWPYAHEMEAYQTELSQSVGVKTWVPPRRAEEYLEGLGEALGREEEPGRAEELLDHFQSPVLHQVVLTHAPVGEALLVGAYQQTRRLLALTQNPRLSQEQAAGMVAWAERRVAEVPASGRASEEALSALSVLERLGRQTRFQSLLGPALLDALTERLPRIDREANPHLYEESFFRRVRSTLAALTPLLQPEQMERLLPRMQEKDGFGLSALAAHPQASISFLRRLVRESGSDSVRAALIRRKEAMWDEELGPWIGEGVESVLDEVLRNGEGLAFQRALERRMEKKAPEALDLLWGRLPEVWASTPVDVLVRPLRSRREEVRERARDLESLLRCLRAEREEETAEQALGVVARGARAAERLLDSLPETRLRALPRRVWTAMLAREDGALRLRVIRQLGQQGGVEERVPESGAVEANRGGRGRG